MIPFPNKKYQIIYADPPWKYRENWGNGAVAHHYKSMDFEEIKSLPVKDIADNNCHLYLWITNPFLQEGLNVVKSWGFEYKQLITWLKTYKNKEPIMGLGYYFRVCTEHCIFGLKGKLPRIKKDLKNIIISDQLKHSEKPHEFRDLIIQHSGNLPRIELFARKPKGQLFEDESFSGWDCWGNEI